MALRAHKSSATAPPPMIFRLSAVAAVTLGLVACSSSDNKGTPADAGGNAAQSACKPQEFEGTAPAQQAVPFTADACTQSELEALASCASEDGCSVERLSPYCLKCAFGTKVGTQELPGAFDAATFAVNVNGC